MPALVDFPQVVRIHLEFQLEASHTGGVRFFWSYQGGPPTAPNLDTVASGVSAAFGTDLAQLMVIAFALEKVVVTDLTTDSSPEGQWNGSIPGTRAGNGFPADVCACLVSKVPRRYRGGKPKIFMPFGAAPDVAADDATWTPAFQSSVNSQWIAFKTALGAIVGAGITLKDHVNLSYYEGFVTQKNEITGRTTNPPKPRDASNFIAPDVISSTVCAPVISVQRRRRFTPA